MAKQDDFIRLQVRLPKELHESLVEAVSKSGRSMNSEIVERLYASHSTIDELRDVVRESLTRNVDIDRINFDIRKAAEYKQHLKDVIKLIVALLKNQDRTDRDERDAMMQLLELLSDLS